MAAAEPSAAINVFKKTNDALLIKNTYKDPNCNARGTGWQNGKSDGNKHFFNTSDGDGFVTGRDGGLPEGFAKKMLNGGWMAFESLLKA